MPIALIMLAAAYFEKTTIAMMVAFCLFCKLVSYRSKNKLELLYSSKNKLFAEFVKETKISTLEFEPYVFAPVPLLQGVFYLIAEGIYENFFPDKFDRELIKTPDGGTIGLDWDGGIPELEDVDKKPILVVCPGLGGGSFNLYCTALIWLARSSGFKCTTLCFRGANDMPITSGKLSYSGCWEDVECCLEYIAKQYNVRDEKTGKRKTRVYAFGASLGAQILALYMGKAGKKASDVLDGAVLYANAWSIRTGSKFFYENFFGLY